MAKTALIVAAAAVVLYVLLVELPAPTFVSHENGALLISGASSGIGLDAAVAIAAQGPYTVFAGVRKDADKAGVVTACDTTSNAEACKKNIKPVILDVTKQETIESAHAAVAAWVAESKQPFVALVNNAGVFKSGPVEMSAVNDYREGLCRAARLHSYSHQMANRGKNTYLSRISASCCSCCLDFIDPSLRSVSDFGRHYNSALFEALPAALS